MTDITVTEEAVIVSTVDETVTITEDGQTGAEIKALYEAESDTNAYTDAEKTKLSGIAAGAEVNVNADWSSESGDSEILNKPTLVTDHGALTGLTPDDDHPHYVKKIESAQSLGSPTYSSYNDFILLTIIKSSSLYPIIIPSFSSFLFPEKSFVTNLF